MLVRGGGLKEILPLSLSQEEEKREEKVSTELPQILLHSMPRLMPQSMPRLMRVYGAGKNKGACFIGQEERRLGGECRSWWGLDHDRKNRWV